jgi:hypothetical protein
LAGDNPYANVSGKAKRASEVHMDREWLETMALIGIIGAVLFHLAFVPYLGFCVIRFINRAADPRARFFLVIKRAFLLLLLYGVGLVICGLVDGIYYLVAPLLFTEASASDLAAVASMARFFALGGLAFAIPSFLGFRYSHSRAEPWKGRWITRGELTH